VTGMDRLDPLAAWDALDPAMQRQIGAAAIAEAAGAMAMAVLGVGDAAQAVELSFEEAADLYDQSLPYANAVTASCERLAVLVQSCLGYGDGALPPVPDLRPLGIRQCRSCGCTDERLREGGCSWVETDLCSACVPGAWHVPDQKPR
jgi:hypothetical protein